MQVLQDVSSLFERYVTQLVTWAYIIKALVGFLTDSIVISKFETVLRVMTKTIQMFWSEGYCYFLDFLRIAYYPVTNRFTRENNRPRFANTSKTKVSMLGHNEALQLTG